MKQKKHIFCIRLDFRIRRLENKNVKRNDADGREERNKSCAHKATNNTKGTRRRTKAYTVRLYLGNVQLQKSIL